MQRRSRIGTGLRRDIGDALADLESTDPGAERFDDARALPAETRRQRIRVQPGALVDVDEIEPDGGLADERFAPARLTRVVTAPSA